MGEASPTSHLSSTITALVRERNPVPGKSAGNLSPGVLPHHPPQNPHAREALCMPRVWQSLVPGQKPHPTSQSPHEGGAVQRRFLSRSLSTARNGNLRTLRVWKFLHQEVQRCSLYTEIHPKVTCYQFRHLGEACSHKINARMVMRCYQGCPTHGPRASCGPAQNGKFT